MERDVIHLQCTVKKYTDFIQCSINLATICYENEI